MNEDLKIEKERMSQSQGYIRRVPARTLRVVHQAVLGAMSHTGPRQLRVIVYRNIGWLQGICVSAVGM